MFQWRWGRTGEMGTQPVATWRHGHLQRGSGGAEQGIRGIPCGKEEWGSGLEERRFKLQVQLSMRHTGCYLDRLAGHLPRGPKWHQVDGAGFEHQPCFFHCVASTWQSTQ